METKFRYALRRIDGVYVNIKYEPVKSLSHATRFVDIEEYQKFITGYYKPHNASQYMPQKIKITYEECEEDVQ